MKSKMLFFLIISLLISCKKEQKILSNSEKVVNGLKEEIGPFDEVDYGNDSTRIIYSYRPEKSRTEKVKGVIDKYMNLVGTESISKYKSEYELVFGSYKWETPTEQIQMRGAHVYKDSSTYINIWIDAK